MELYSNNCYTMPKVRNSIPVFWTILFILASFTGHAQSDSFQIKKAAAVAELKKFPKPDTHRVKALVAILKTPVYLKERKEVLVYQEEAMELSRSLGYRKGLAQTYLSRANYYKSASEYPTALINYDSVINTIGNTTEQEMLRSMEWAYEQKGHIYYTQENYYAALDHFFEALKYPSSNEKRRKARIYSFITETYTQLNNLEKAREYALLNIALIEGEPNVANYSTVYFSYIDVCLEQNDLETASLYLDKLSPAVPDPKEGQMNFGYYMKRGRISYMQHQYASAYRFFQEGHKYALKGGHTTSKSFSLYHLARTALELGYNEEAKNYALENLALTEQMNAKSGRIEALINLSSYYRKAGDKDKAFELIYKAMALKDSLTRETNSKQVNVLGAIYDYGKQQKEIATLQNEKDRQTAAVKQKSFLNYVFIASIIALLLVGYLVYNNFRKGQQLARQQQALQDQKIIDLEKDKQLLTIDAMLKGQEEERSRIAKDLHDGVGSLLSGTKLSFMNVKETQEFSGTGKILFEKSLSMLDNTINELRKVAQNLMPEALVKFGLHEAVRDFCDSIESSSGIKVLYQQVGEKRKLDNTAEVFTYRIIQELVNNAVKHARATQIIVQLAMDLNKTGITVEDDGRGFDKTRVNGTRGAGQANINYRVQYFNGTCDVITSPGNGTSINIELIA